MKSVRIFALLFFLISAFLLSQPKIFLHQVDVSDFPKVKVYISVLDQSGNSIKGLDEKNFSLNDSGFRITNFACSSIFPNREWIALVIALDRSGSMKGRPFADAKKGARVLIQKVGLLDKIAILFFDEVIQWKTDFIRDKELLKEKLETGISSKNTALYDAIFQSVDKLESIHAPRKAVVILSDGKDTESSKSRTECIGKVREGNIPVHIIGLGEQINRDFIENIAEESHGNYHFAVSSSELQNIYASIAEQLENQYILSYVYEADKKPGIHNLEVEMNYMGEHIRDKILYSLDTYAYEGTQYRVIKPLNKMGLYIAALAGGILGVIVFLILNKLLFEATGTSRRLRTVFVVLGAVLFMTLGVFIYYFI